MSVKFSLGAVTATPAALTVMGRLGIDGTDLLKRHVQGDWGDIPREDRELNDWSVDHANRIHSFYYEGDDRLYVITEADRSVTTILTPGDY